MSEELCEGLDNTNAIASIVETGDLHEVNMILGSRERIRHAGVIRPGIKILLRDATEAQKKLYKQLLDENFGFEHIDAELLKIAPKGYAKKTCLMPSNSDYFTIRDEDFKRPADAEYIRKHYADADGKVRRIPCWLPLSDIEKVIPHNFRAFSAGGLRCVSFYDEGRLKFKYLPKDFKGTPKSEDWKILDSDDEDKATAACGIKVRFGGMYRVYVPGTRGAGEIICPTQSWYGLGESVSVLKRVRAILGRFDGLFNGNAFFELCKVAETVKTPDGKRQQQWIVTLELAADPMELARYAEPQAVAARSLQALSAFGGAPLVAVNPSPVLNMPLSAAVVSTVVDSPLAGTGDAVQMASGDLPPVSSSGVSTQDLHAAGIAYLQNLIAPVSLFMADMDNLSASMYSGLVVQDLDTDTLREFCRKVRDEISKRGAAFTDDMKAMRAA